MQEDRKFILTNLLHLYSHCNSFETIRLIKHIRCSVWVSLPICVWFLIDGRLKICIGKIQTTKTQVQSVQLSASK